MIDINNIEFTGVLSGISKEATIGILSSCSISYHKKDSELFASQQNNSILYILLEGELKVDFEDKNDNIPIKLFAGETVGEMSVIDGSPTSARVYATIDSTLLEINQTDFWRLIRASHQFSMNMLQQLSRRVRKDNTVIKESIEEKNQLLVNSILDPMTTLYNRRWLSENGERILNRFKISKQPFSVLMLDIDHFKNVNDSYGHQTGDEILVSVSKVIKQVIRPTDFAVRYGGEEFLVFLTDTNLSDALIPAERIRSTIEKATKKNIIKDVRPEVTISCGISTLSDNDNSIEILISSADKNLYRAKNSGRNRIEY